MALTIYELRSCAIQAEKYLLECGDPLGGDDWSLMQIIRSWLADHPGNELSSNTCQLPASFGLNDFAALCHDESKAKGWHSSAEGDPAGPKRIATMLLLIVSELTEAFECVRDGCVPAGNYGSDGKPEGFAVEIADALIRIGDMAAALGLDLDAVVAMKLAYNRTRPHRHGNKAA